jgi:hypothetical protein
MITKQEIAGVKREFKKMRQERFLDFDGFQSCLRKRVFGSFHSLLEQGTIKMGGGDHLSLN